MSVNTRTILFVVITLAVVGGIGYFNIRNDIKDRTAVKDDEKTPLPIADERDSSGKEQRITLQPNETATLSGKATGEKPTVVGAVSVPSVSVPDLDQPVVFEGNYSAKQQDEIKGQVKILTDILKADPNSFNEWMDLALLLKSIGDYEWARDAWEYAGAIRPNASLPFVNLGTLYGYYLKNPVKAEANLLHAIENEPRLLDFYARMVDFYVEVMNDKGKAVDFLDRAIEKYPEWTELKDLRGYTTG